MNLILLLIPLFSARVSGDKDLLLQVVCEESEDGYLVPDPVQCDRFAECTPRGKRIIQLCTDGYGLDLNNGKCDLISKVNCTGREKQQAPTGVGLCPRLNGNFAISADISCSDYVDCREGRPFQQSCGFGAVFDEILGCVHPDQTKREGCTATEVFGFKCPKFSGNMRFGDHERLPHPSDCAYFYACLSSGQPRLLGCERPKVFNPVSGLCDKPSNVPGCEGYYPQDELDKITKEERSKIEAEIRAELEEKFGLRKGSLDSQDINIDSARSDNSDRTDSKGSSRFTPSNTAETFEDNYSKSFRDGPRASGTNSSPVDINSSPVDVNSRPVYVNSRSIDSNLRAPDANSRVSGSNSGPSDVSRSTFGSRDSSQLFGRLRGGL